jgi:hypothetical protein
MTAFGHPNRCSSDLKLLQFRPQSLPKSSMMPRIVRCGLHLLEGSSNIHHASLRLYPRARPICGVDKK